MEDHKFYVTNNIVEYNSRTQIYEMTCKIFTDDLETAIQGQSPQPIRIGTTDEYIKTDMLIHDYLNKHFKIRINDSPVQFKYVGKKVSPDLTEVFMEFTYADAANSISVEHNGWFEFFPDHKNIIDIRMNGWYYTMILTKDHPSEIKYR